MAPVSVPRTRRQRLQYLTLRSHWPALATAPTVGLGALTVSSPVDCERPHPLQSRLPPFPVGLRLGAVVRLTFANVYCRHEQSVAH